MNLIQLKGTIVRGYGVASGRAVDTPFPGGTIDLQRPYFMQRGLDLSNMFGGTLNVSIAPRTFCMVNPSITFTGVNWSPLIPPEDFSFSPCTIKHGEHTVSGLVYYPHPATKKQHFQDASCVEVLAPFLQGAQYGDPVLLSLDIREISVL